MVDQSLSYYARRAMQILLRKLGSKPVSPLNARVADLQRMIRHEKQDRGPPRDSFNPKRMRITWVIPDFHPGAGGHMSIFRIASWLRQSGHEVSILIQNPLRHATAQEALRTINESFGPFDGTVALLGATLPELDGDALIATDRFTCYAVDAMGGFRRKFYLVQDHETLFYPMGAEALLAEMTYRFDFDCLCAGAWLETMMRDRYGRWAMAWQLALDPAIYHETGEPRAANRIALYARYVTPRRAVELALMALDLLHARGVRFEVDFYGWDLGKLDVPYPFTDHGVVNQSRLAALYRKATVGVVFSATNHSIVNKEMMACGLPVLDLDIESVRAVFPPGAIAMAEPLPEKIADRLQVLLANESERAALREAGLGFVKDLSWEKSARLVEAAIVERVGLAATPG